MNLIFHTYTKMGKISKSVYKKGRDLLKFGVSEDMFRSLEVLLTLRDFSDT